MKKGPATTGLDRGSLKRVPIFDDLSAVVEQPAHWVFPSTGLGGFPNLPFA
jgi:hypothetical protein